MRVMTTAVPGFAAITCAMASKIKTKNVAVIKELLLFQILKIKKREAGASFTSDRDERLGYAPLTYEERSGLLEYRCLKRNID